MAVSSAVKSASFSLGEERIEWEFYYPIVVFQGPIYTVSVRGLEVEVVEASRLRFHHSMSGGRHVLATQIDVMTERELGTFIKDTIRREPMEIVKVIREKGLYKQLLTSAVAQKKIAAHGGTLPINLNELAFG